MEYYNNILSFEAGWLIESDIVTKYNYDALVRRNQFHIVRRASRNTPALIAYDSMPERIKKAIKEKIKGDPYEQIKYSELEDLIEQNAAASDFFESFKLNDGRFIPKQTRLAYYNNAIVLEAIHKLIISKRGKRCAKSSYSWATISEAVQNLDRTRYPHDLPSNFESLKKKFDKYRAKDGGYITLIHKNFMKDRANAAKINDEFKESILIELLGDPRNLDNMRIARLYNQVAEPMGWRKISGDAVATYRDKYELETYAGRHGSVALYNNKLMQVRRSAPTMPLYYVTMDGWDVELLYQRTENGRTFYHHRVTVVVVLDPCKKYPIGYAIGTHETPELIKAALRNAAKHSAELFGKMYRSHQLQSDRYAFKALTPIYEAMAVKVTPARAKNAKAKIIEPYFKYLNTEYCQLQPNWSGFGVTADKNNQPNTEFLNKYKTRFPDYDGVVKQVASMMELERQSKRDAYLSQWAKVNEADKIELSYESYLRTFGELTGYKNMLQGSGINTTIKGIKRAYECFDLNFRRYASTQWNIVYDPDDTSRILAMNDDESLRFVLEDKYTQPMALRDRQDGDAYELKRVSNFNAQAIEYITESRAQSADNVRELFERNPQLDGTLAKILLTDSTGQHKNNRNIGRAKANAIESAVYIPVETETKSIYEKY
ncbi:hypothetical protein [Dysgonomonas sp. GY617]|uniref:hypothetical protein n=1 Tax=Dysgonomonas sp. GY617 TaxID=2780420 RepID=UPI001883211A|nr:hypothetical protein [Dysgonomonas sp. GY617]MBF0576630.1 hypothetical protein [Dysgonomonas sp. GY617]